MIKQGSTVKLNYKGTLSNGSQFDSTAGREPFQFQVGTRQVIPGFENGLIGKNTGEKVTITIPPSDGYGEIREDLFINVPKSQLPADIQVGKQLQAVDNGNAFNVLVKEIHDDYAIIDANHPLAGQELTFEIEVLEVI